jgi:hypothetical protein
MKLIDHELQLNAPIKFTNPFHLYEAYNYKRGPFLQWCLQDKMFIKRIFRLALLFCVASFVRAHDLATGGMFR